MIPHLVWLKEVDFVPLTYAGDVYSLPNRAQVAQLVLGYIGHNLALLLAPVALALLALALVPRWWQTPRAIVTRAWSRGPNPAVNRSQALNVWIIQLVVAIGPPLGALFFDVYIKTDWGISLFFLTPLALVAIPALPPATDGAVQHRRDLARRHARHRLPDRPPSPCATWRRIRTALQAMSRARNWPAN